ncbi:hypothetical protein BJ138DRAFT_967103, partial [Hygrophoropsis aurantiaca]
ASQQRQAGSRSLLRYNLQNNGEHLSTRRPGGLHPSYIGFHSKLEGDDSSAGDLEKQFLRDTTGNIFDAIAVQDRLDGGMTVMVHCPGAEATPNIPAEDIALDVYVSPRELNQSPEKVGEITVAIIR